MEGRTISRKEILSGDYKWRGDLIPLVLSKHARRRVEERIDGEFIIVPSVARITKENICSGREKGGYLTNVKIRLDYKRDKWMFLVICPATGVVKTLYINYKDAKKEEAARKKQGIEEGCCVEIPYYEEENKGKAQDTGTIISPEGRTGKTMEVFHANMGETQERGRETSFRNLWGILGSNA